MPTFQHFCPSNCLPRWPVFARWRGGGLTVLAIGRFVRRYGVDMSEAANPDRAAYPTFKRVFTRPLRDGARPFARLTFYAPSTAWSDFRTDPRERPDFSPKRTQLIARRRWSAATQLAARFQNGAFATLYLIRRDYHRIHMPCDGVLRQMIYTSGDSVLGQPGNSAFSARPVCAQERD